jgi:hypothetical protein
MPQGGSIDGVSNTRAIVLAGSGLLNTRHDTRLGAPSDKAPETVAARPVNYASPRCRVTGVNPSTCRPDVYSVSLGAAVELARDQIKLLARAIKRLH